MEINMNNYEVFIIDYLDNKLGPVETAQLLLFLENHPGLKEEFEDLKTLTVTPSANESFGFNESLKQPADLDAVNLSMLNYTHYFIADVEGDLTPTGRNLVAKFLHEHPELVNEYNLFSVCKLQANNKITYPSKDELKIKQKPVYLRYYLATGIAASLLLLITVFMKLTPESEKTVKQAIQHSIENQINTNNSPATTKEVKPSDEKGDAANTPTAPVIDKKATKESNTVKKAKSVPAVNTGERKIAPPVKKLEKRNVFINNTGLITENKTRNFYSDLYDDIRLSQELTIAELEEEASNQERQNELAASGSQQQGSIRGITAGRILSSVISSGAQVAEQLPESINGWLVADLGLKGFNLITNNKYSIDRKYSDKGNIERLKLVNAEKKL